MVLEDLLLFHLRLEVGSEGTRLPCRFLSFLVNDVRYMMAAKQFGGRTL